MAKLKLNPDPTFRAKVAIQGPGQNPDPVEFVFKHRTREEMLRFLKEADEAPAVVTEDDAVTLIEKMATGWELADPFSRESLLLLVQNYMTAPRTIFDTYVEHLAKAREKNSSTSR